MFLVESLQHELDRMPALRGRGSDALKLIEALATFMSDRSEDDGDPEFTESQLIALLRSEFTEAFIIRVLRAPEWPSVARGAVIRWLRDQGTERVLLEIAPEEFATAHVENRHSVDGGQRCVAEARVRFQDAETGETSVLPIGATPIVDWRSPGRSRALNRAKIHRQSSAAAQAALADLRRSLLTSADGTYGLPQIATVFRQFQAADDRSSSAAVGVSTDDLGGLASPTLASVDIVSDGIPALWRAVWLPDDGPPLSDRGEIAERLLRPRLGQADAYAEAPVAQSIFEHVPGLLLIADRPDIERLNLVSAVITGRSGTPELYLMSGFSGVELAPFIRLASDHLARTTACVRRCRRWSRLLTVQTSGNTSKCSIEPQERLIARMALASMVYVVHYAQRHGVYT